MSYSYVCKVKIFVHWQHYIGKRPVNDLLVLFSTSCREDPSVAISAGAFTATCLPSTPLVPSVDNKHQVNGPNPLFLLAYPVPLMLVLHVFLLLLLVRSFLFLWKPMQSPIILRSEDTKKTQKIQAWISLPLDQSRDTRLKMIMFLSTRNPLPASGKVTRFLVLCRIPIRWIIPDYSYSQPLSHKHLLFALGTLKE